MDDLVETAASAGLDASKVQDLVERAAREVDAGLLPSCQLALARDGEVVVEVTHGADPTARYAIFSATKALTGAGIWRLLSDGRLSIDTRVAEVLDGFGANGKDAVTVEHLLTHTSGFPHAPLVPSAWGDRDERLATYRRWRAVFDPGTHYEYHPTAAHWVLADVIVEVTGVDHRSWLRDEVLVPLGLGRMRLGVAPDESPESAFDDVRVVTALGESPTPDELEEAIGIRLDLAELVGEVTDEAKEMIGRPEHLAVGIPGGGGVSTAGDLALLYQGILHDDGALWDPEVLHLATAEVRCDLPDPIRGTPSHRTLGLILAGDDGLGYLRGFGRTASPRTFGHGGAGGQIAFADPDSGLSFAYVTDGHDRHLIREGRRTIGLASRAAACAAGQRNR